MPKATFPTENDAIPTSNPESSLIHGNIVYEGPNDPDYKMDLNYRGNAIILILDGEKTRRAIKDAEMLESVLKDKWKLIGAKLQVESEHLDMVLQHIATSDDVLQNDSDCLFLAILYHEKTFPIQVKGKKDLQVHDIWNHFTKEKNVKMTSRPKIFLFLEYPEIQIRGAAADSTQVSIPDGKGSTPAALTSVIQPSHINFFFIHGYGAEFMETFEKCLAENPEMDLVDLATTINRESRINSKRFSHYMSTLIRNLKFLNRADKIYWSSEEDYQNKSKTLANSIDVILSIKREVTKWLNKLDMIQKDDVATKEMKMNAEALFNVITVANENGNVPAEMIPSLRFMVEREYEEFEKFCAIQASIANQ